MCLCATNTMEDIEAMVYPPLGLWVFDVSLSVTISLVVRFHLTRDSSNDTSGWPIGGF